MKRYTNQERIELVQWYFESNSSIVCVQRKFGTKYRYRPAPNSNTIRNIISKFSISGSVGDAYHIGRPRTCRLKENITRVRNNVRQRPRTSSRRRAQQFHISTRYIRRILKDDLHLYSYKVQITQSLHNTDHENA